MKSIEQGSEKKIKVTNSYKNCFAQIVIKKVWIKPMSYNFLPKYCQETKTKKISTMSCVGN